MPINSLKIFRIVAFLEGCSFILFSITMPLKYWMHLPKPNLWVGMAHGILFLVYVGLLLWVALQYKWSFKKVLLAFIAAFIPFGTFIADKKLFRQA
jgi:integral membrane protein